MNMSDIAALAILIGAGVGLSTDQGQDLVQKIKSDRGGDMTVVEKLNPFSNGPERKRNVSAIQRVTVVGVTWDDKLSENYYPDYLRK